MSPVPDEPAQPETFPTALAFVVALFPVLVFVGTFFPDGSDCASDADTAQVCGYWYTHYTDSTFLIAAAATVTILWLIFGLRFFLTRLRAMPPERARQAVFLYVLLTCSLCFLILPTALVTVLIVFVFSEIVLRLHARSRVRDR